ncbi:MAG: hypothetical protein GY765_39255 [bacterium]|nr:hypothetical protein [bacterium]
MKKIVNISAVFAAILVLRLTAGAYSQSFPGMTEIITDSRRLALPREAGTPTRVAGTPTRVAGPTPRGGVSR